MKKRPKKKKKAPSPLPAPPPPVDFNGLAKRAQATSASVGSREKFVEICRRAEARQELFTRGDRPRDLS